MRPPHLRTFLFLAIVACGPVAQGQYKNDNVLFKTIDPADLCAALDKNKGYILLDVRSRGEHMDTSMSPGYNLGHLDGAINIDIRELGRRMQEIGQYKDRPVFVYCSHSQRSRRAGKMLADSGFTNILNINGGMTAIYYTDASKAPCLQQLVKSSNPYKIISANELCKSAGNSDKPMIIDVRSDSAYNHISLNPKENAYGWINASTHISLADLPAKIASLPRDRPIILTDIYGDEASRAAAYMAKQGFTNVSVLVEGIDRLLLTDQQNLPCKNLIYKSPVSYRLLNVSEFARFAGATRDVVLLDVRTREEFESKHKDSWRNIGHLQHAVNIPSDQLQERISELDAFKDKEIVIYSFGSSPDVFASANLLQQKGFRKVSVVMGGLFNLRWTAANTKGNEQLKSMVVDIPAENQ